MKTRVTTSLGLAVMMAAVCWQAVAPIAAQNQPLSAVPGYENLKPLGPDNRVVPRKTIPRAPDGKPDFSGVWAGPGYTHQVGPGDTDVPSLARLEPKLFPPFQSGGERFMFRPETGDVLHDDPTSVCLPNGMPRQLLSFYAQQWIQAPRNIVVNYEYMHFPRVIPIGAANRPHADWDAVDTWMGHSIAWWEGDTLVIDTIGLKEWWFQAAHNPTMWHSNKLHLQERLSYTDSMTVRYDVVYDDPVIWTRPWTQTYGMKLHPTWSILEYVCEENDRCAGGSCKASEAQK